MSVEQYYVFRPLAYDDAFVTTSADGIEAIAIKKELVQKENLEILEKIIETEIRKKLGGKESEVD